MRHRFPGRRDPLGVQSVPVCVHLWLMVSHRRWQPPRRGISPARLPGAIISACGATGKAAQLGEGPVTPTRQSRWCSGQLMVSTGAKLLWPYHAHQSRAVMWALPDAPPLDGQGCQHREGQHASRRVWWLAVLQTGSLPSHPVTTIPEQRSTRPRAGCTPGAPPGRGWPRGQSGWRGPHPLGWRRRLRETAQRRLRDVAQAAGLLSRVVGVPHVVFLKSVINTEDR
jgi:hypothetical protein